MYVALTVNPNVHVYGFGRGVNVGNCHDAIVGYRLAAVGVKFRNEHAFLDVVGIEQLRVAVIRLYGRAHEIHVAHGYIVEIIATNGVGGHIGCLTVIVGGHIVRLLESVDDIPFQVSDDDEVAPGEVHCIYVRSYRLEEVTVEIYMHSAEIYVVHKCAVVLELIAAYGKPVKQTELHVYVLARVNNPSINLVEVALVRACLICTRLT